MWVEVATGKRSRASLNSTVVNSIGDKQLINSYDN